MDAGVVAVLGTEHEALSKQIAPMLAARNILFVSPSPALTTENTPDDILIYQTAPSPTMLGKELTRRILDDSHQRIAILHSGDDFCTGFAKTVAGRIEYNFATVTANIEQGLDVTALPKLERTNYPAFTDPAVFRIRRTSTRWCSGIATTTT